MLLFILTIWKSSEPWKYALSMNDKNYLPVPPIFSLVQLNNGNLSPKFVLRDMLTFENFSDKEKSNKNFQNPFSGKYYINRLNKKITPSKDINDLIAFCEFENVAQACLILGRIFEFGSYNQSENLNQSYSYYNKALSLKDSSANSPLAFFHRHIFPNIPLSIIEDDYNSHFVESILVKSNEYESGFTRPFSCMSIAKMLISLSNAIINMYFKFPYAQSINRQKRLTINSKQQEYIWKMLDITGTCSKLKVENKNDGYNYFQQGFAYLFMPYPTDEELDISARYFEKAICSGYYEALPFLAELKIHEINSLINNFQNEKNEKLAKLFDLSFLQDEQFNKYFENSFVTTHFTPGILMKINSDNFQEFNTTEIKEAIRQIHIIRILKCLEPILYDHDPETLIIASSHFLNNANSIIYKANIIGSIIQAISETGYAPAVHKIAELTYYGLLQIPRSASSAFKLYLKSSASNYIPSMFQAAQQLFGGDGVNENCIASVALLRGIVDGGPWTSFYDKYVLLKKSKVAFVRMIEMGLTPPIWLDEFNDTGSLENPENISNLSQNQFEQLINQSLPFHSYITKLIFSLNPLSSGQRDDKALQKIREMRRGNCSSLLWLVLHSKISDALMWLDRAESLPFDTFYLSQFARFVILIKGIFKYASLDSYDRYLLKMMFAPYISDFLLIISTLTFTLLFGIRIYYYLS